MVAGDSPSFASDRQNFASGTPTAMSQAATSPTPPAKAGPCTRAMVGLRMRSSVLSIVRERLRVGQVLLVAVAGHALHPVEVRPCAECRPVAREHHGAHAFVGVELAQGTWSAR